MTATEIIDALRGHYKRIRVRRVSVDGNDVHFVTDGVAPYLVAKFILSRFPDARWCFSEGGFTTAVYSRETIKWNEWKR